MEICFLLLAPHSQMKGSILLVKANNIDKVHLSLKLKVHVSNSVIFILFRHMFLSDVWFGVAPRTNIKKAPCV